MQKTPDFMPEFRANLPRNSHVLSHNFGFTCTTAHLLPVFHTLVSPGDTIKVGFDFNLRTMPLEAAAFADLDCHTEYFFVPMQLLYQPFDSVYYGITDLWSSKFGSTGNVLPLLDFSTFFSNLATYRSSAAATYGQAGIQVESMGQSAIRLMDMLGYDPSRISGQPTVNYLPNAFPYPLLAYNCIYQNFYRLDAREVFNAQSFNWDQFANSSLVGSWSYVYGLLHYRPLDNDYFTDIKVSPIVDVLNMTPKNELPVVNSWLSRSSLKDHNLLSHSVISSGSEGSEFDKYGQYGGQQGSRNEPNNFIQTQFGFSQGFVNFENDSLGSPMGVPNGFDINTANIRALFANEKLWSITGRAKKTYDDQTLAHFGFKVPHDVKHQVSCFGRDHSQIHIGEVISTASTSNAPLGEIAGKGYGQQNSERHQFTAPCHGVIMVIFSVTARHNYEGGILKANMVTSKEDLFVPEYDHLGMQPLFGYETGFYEDQTGGVWPNNEDPTAILGWQYRFEQWKRRYNRVSGAFAAQGGTLRSWIPNYFPYSGVEEYHGKINNLPNNASSACFINLPTDLNYVMLGSYPAQWSSAYSSDDDWRLIYDHDPFVVNSNIDCVLVSTMSDYSLPRLDA